MRHKVESKRLNRDLSHLDSMTRNLATSIILYEKVKTTQSKAKFIKPIVEKLISSAKKQSLAISTRGLNSYLTDKNATQKLTHELVERYKERNSGFLRITALGFRKGDAAPVVQIELV